VGGGTVIEREVQVREMLEIREGHRVLRAVRRVRWKLCPLREELRLRYVGIAAVACLKHDSDSRVRIVESVLLAMEGMDRRHGWRQHLLRAREGSLWSLSHCMLLRGWIAYRCRVKRRANRCPSQDPFERCFERGREGRLLMREMVVGCLLLRTTMMRLREFIVATLASAAAAASIVKVAVIPLRTTRGRVSNMPRRGRLIHLSSQRLMRVVWRS
jgi:hypothetical protein